MPTIAIIGLGLIGTSLGLALKQRSPELTIVGMDRERGHAEQARKMGAVDRVEASATAAVAEAELVIIATPIIAVRPTLQEIAPALRHGAVVTDTASVKSEIMKAAREVLPPHVNFVGGHPMAGSERSGPEGASATLFVDEKGRGRTYCVVPSLDAHQDAIDTVRGIVQLVGARAVDIDAEEHDALIAAVSHMPIVLSLGLFTLARNSPAWGDLSKLAGPAFKDLTRLAMGSPEMALDIFSSNRDNVIHWLDRLVAEMGRYREMLSGEERPLHEAMLKAQLDRQTFEERPEEDEQRGEPQTPTTNVGEQFMALLVGARLMERGREVEALLKDDPKEQRLRERERERADRDGEENSNGGR